MRFRNSNMDFLRAAYCGSDRPTGRGGREDFVFFFGGNPGMRLILELVDRKYWGALVSPLNTHI
jgi:hypothetical protein